MKKIQIKDEILEVAESWNEITWTQYIEYINRTKDIRKVTELMSYDKYLELSKNTDEESIKIVAKLDKLEYQLCQSLLNVEFLVLLCGDAVRDLEISANLQLVDEIKWAYGEIKTSLRAITIDGVRYAIRKDLDGFTNREMRHYSENNKGLEMEDLMLLVVSILLRPVDSEGNIAKYKEDELQDRMLTFEKNLTAEVVCGLANFFLNGTK